MKLSSVFKIIPAFSLAVALFFVSCSKENVSPSQTDIGTTISTQKQAPDNIGGGEKTNVMYAYISTITGCTGSFAGNIYVTLAHGTYGLLNTASPSGCKLWYRLSGTTAWSSVNYNSPLVGGMPLPLSTPGLYEIAVSGKAIPGCIPAPTTPFSNCLTYKAGATYTYNFVVCPQ